ncbi:MAG: hypothetical protein ACYTFW_11405 [Planctomycetota bacterium]
MDRIERKCKNCEHFRKGSVGYTQHVWGDCVKPGRYSYDAQGTKAPGVFTWAAKSCDDFEPRKTSADQTARDSL